MKFSCFEKATEFLFQISLKKMIWNAVRLFSRGPFHEEIFYLPPPKMLVLVLDFRCPNLLPPAALASSWFVVDMAWSSDFLRVSFGGACDAVSEAVGKGPILRMKWHQRYTPTTSRGRRRQLMTKTQSSQVMSQRRLTSVWGWGRQGARKCLLRSLLFRVRLCCSHARYVSVCALWWGACALGALFWRARPKCTAVM